MEGDRRPVQPYGDDDGDAPVVDHRPAQDDAGPRDQKRHGGDAGENERSDPTTRYVRNAHKLPRRRRPNTKSE